jgi:hypothetical protein
MPHYMVVGKADVTARLIRLTLYTELVLITNLMHNSFIVYYMYYIKYLDMFRAILCSSSGGQNCIFTASGIVTLCEQPYSTLVHYTTADRE